MAGRRPLPDLMSEALGRVGLGGPGPGLPSSPAQVVSLPAWPGAATTDSEESQPLQARLKALGLGAMAASLAQLASAGPMAGLDLAAGLAELLRGEEERRQKRRQALRLRQAQLPLPARLEDLDWRARRGLPRGQISSLAQGGWLGLGQDLLITGPVGTGKTFLACALARAACQQGARVRYWRLGALLRQLGGGGLRRQARQLAELARLDLLVLDDWAAQPLQRWQPDDLLEALDLRHGRRSTLVASALGPEDWGSLLGQGHTAAAILDRLCQQSLWLRLEGPSMRGHYPQARAGAITIRK